jgi:hypothetical protein
MSKKPLVRSKKRAVHTNTKDKLSKLIVEVDSIAKELSKVKKGGLGFGVTSAINLVEYYSKKQNFFTKIGNILNKNKETIMNIKYEFIDLLIDSHIKVLNNNYDNSPFKISEEINNLITNLISTDAGKKGIYDYDELKVDNINQIRRKEEDSDNIVNMKKIAHILNIIKYLYQEVKEDNHNNIIVTTSFDKKTHYTDSKINQILFDEPNNNNKDFRYQFMDDKKNELMENIFEYVSNITSGDQPGLIESIKKLYESINKKNIFDYLPKLEILRNLTISDKVKDIYDNIKLLNKIKFKYDIYTKIICTEPESTKNLFIHEESNTNTKNISFEFLDNYKILEDSKITTIAELKEAIKKFKLENIIKKDDDDRKKWPVLSAFGLKEIRPINEILIKLKTDLETLRTKKKSLVSDSAKIWKNKAITDKNKSLKVLTDTIEGLEKVIGNKMKIFNKIKDKLITKYKAEHSDSDEEKIYKEFNAYFQEKIKSLNFAEEDIEKFNLNEEIVEQQPAEEIVEQQAASDSAAPGGGKLVAKYKSTGESVYILYKKKKIKRCVYEKTKGRGKYCKIDGEYKLLSKLKIM